MSYQPQPIDTSAIQLTPEILQLTELLARSTHDNWARRRMAEGWRYGPHRDDARKEHPGLVPYEELSEAEKDYDRSTALETLKAILALGYQIGQPSLEESVLSAPTPVRSGRRTGVRSAGVRSTSGPRAGASTVRREG